METTREVPAVIFEMCMCVCVWHMNVPCVCLDTQSCPTLCDPMDWPVRLPCPWDFQATILEWVAMPSSRGSSQPRDRTQVSSNAGGFFTHWATRESQGRHMNSCLKIHEKKPQWECIMMKISLFNGVMGKKTSSCLPRWEVYCRFFFGWRFQLLAQRNRREGSFLCVFKKVYWSIVDLQCYITFWCIVRWFGYIYSFSDYSPL